jgi:hypothetical protein
MSWPPRNAKEHASDITDEGELVAEPDALCDAARMFRVPGKRPGAELVFDYAFRPALRKVNLENLFELWYHHGAVWQVLLASPALTAAEVSS